MSRNASDPEHINLLFFLALYTLCLWLLSFLLRFRTYYKLRSVLLGEQDAVSAGQVDERKYPGTFKGWEYDLDQEEWLHACQQGKYMATYSSRKRFAASRDNQATTDIKVRLQQRRALERRNADFDVDVVYHPNFSKIMSRILVHCMRFPTTISSARRLFGVQNPIRATGTHVNYFHMDADQLLGKSLGRAVSDAAEEANGGNGQGIPVPLHALKFGLTRTTVTVGTDFPESPGLGVSRSPVPILNPPPILKRRLRRKGTPSEPKSPQVNDATLSPTSPPLLQSSSISGAQGSLSAHTSGLASGCAAECPLSTTSSDGTFGLPMRRQDTLGISCYDKTTRDAMAASGLRLMKIEVDVHRDVNHKNINLSALLLVSRQDLVIELWNSITRKEEEGGQTLHQDASQATTSTNRSQSVETTLDRTPACSADYSGVALESSLSEQSSSLYNRRSNAGGSLSISHALNEKKEEEGDATFSNFVKQVSTASIVNSPPLSLVRDEGRRARIADDTALETSTDTDVPSTPFPLSPATLPLSPTTSEALFLPSALQGAYRKVSFVQVLHSDQLQQMEETCDDNSADVFPIVLVVEHKQSGTGRRRNSNAISEVAMVYCGRIVGGGGAGHMREEDTAGGSLLVEFKLEYVRIGGLLYGIETPVFNVGAPGIRARQVSLVKPARRADNIPPPTWSAPTTPWGTLMPPISPYGSPSLTNISHARTSSFRSCASIDSNNNSRSNNHFRTSSLNSSAGISEDDSNMCLVCFEEERCMVFISCGHFAVCGTCLNQLSDCPVCRTPIKEYLYLSVKSPPPTPTTTSTTSPEPGVTVDGALDRFVKRLKNIPARFEELQQRCPRRAPPPQDEVEAVQELAPIAANIRPRFGTTAALLPPATLHINNSGAGSGEEDQEQRQTPQQGTQAIFPLEGGASLGSIEFDQDFRSFSSFSEREASLPSEGTVAPPPGMGSQRNSTATQRDTPLDAHPNGATPVHNGPSVGDVFSATLVPSETGLTRSERASGSVGSPPPYAVSTHRNTPIGTSHHVDPIFLGAALEEGIDSEGV